MIQNEPIAVISLIVLSSDLVLDLLLHDFDGTFV